jgi:hypothetical protein
MTWSEWAGDALDPSQYALLRAPYSGNDAPKAAVRCVGQFFPVTHPLLQLVLFNLFFQRKSLLFRRKTIKWNNNFLMSRSIYHRRGKTRNVWKCWKTFVEARRIKKARHKQQQNFLIKINDDLLFIFSVKSIRKELHLTRVYHFLCILLVTNIELSRNTVRKLWFEGTTFKKMEKKRKKSKKNVGKKNHRFCLRLFSKSWSSSSSDDMVFISCEYPFELFVAPLCTPFVLYATGSCW